MLDMGFYDSIAEIIEQTPTKRQTLLFSATYPKGIAELAGRFLRDPQQVKVEALHDDSQIEQRFYEIDPAQRMDAVVHLLLHYRPQSSVAFCHTRQQCQELVEHLQANRISAQTLHGELEQRERDQVLTLFANRSCSVLVATDAAARGLDIAGLEAVINVELSRDPEIHVHRVGRSGRAGEKGLALSLVAPPRPAAPRPSRTCRRPLELAASGRTGAAQSRPLGAADGYAMYQWRAQGEGSPGRHPRRPDR